MATNAPNTGAPTRAPFNPAPPSAVTRVLTRFDRADLASFIAVAIDLLDVADGDTDTEPNGDELDGSLGEDDFHAQSEGAIGGPGCPIADPGGAGQGEDDEDDDPDMCLAGDDRVMSGSVVGGGGYLADGPGDADDAEREQMIDDVPMLPVVAIEPNLFDGKRPYLGRSNLMTTFRSNGGAELSADTGRRIKRRGNLNRPRIGTPV